MNPLKKYQIVFACSRAGESEVTMGFVMDWINEGFYGACCNAYYDNLAKDICKRNGFNVSVPIEDDEDENEEVTTDSRLKEEVDPYNTLLFRVIRSAAVTSAQQQPYALLEVTADKFSKDEITANIEEAVRRFGISKEDKDDMMVLMTGISVFLYAAGLADNDTVFEALNKDAALYGIANEICRLCIGSPMDEKLLPVSLDSGMEAEVFEELRTLADWELVYLVDCIDSPNLFGRVKETHKKVIDCLERQKKEAKNIEIVEVQEGDDDV